jgi:Fur family transcriptional regulator, ferric uptake regulator
MEQVRKEYMPHRKFKREFELFYNSLGQAKDKKRKKKTYQKDLILETFLNTEGHLSVENIYSLVKKKDKKVGIVTVFRTLKFLTECGLARVVLLDDGLTRFEHSFHHPPHHHIICTQCHKTIEFVSPELEKIQSEIIKKYRFQPVQHNFQTYGICAECREHRAISEMPQIDTEKIFARDALKMALTVENKSMEFYRKAAGQNQDSAGREIFECMAKEEANHIAELNAQLEELHRQERGLEQAPIFLHFDAEDLNRLIPDLDHFRRNGELNLSAKDSLELAMSLEQGTAGFFRDYSKRFIETLGRQVFLNFAEAEGRHYQTISRHMEELLPGAQSLNA